MKSTYYCPLCGAAWLGWRVPEQLICEVVKCVDTLGSCALRGGDQNRQLIKMSPSHLHSNVNGLIWGGNSQIFPSFPRSSVPCSQLFCRGELRLWRLCFAFVVAEDSVRVRPFLSSGRTLVTSTLTACDRARSLAFL